MKSEQETEFSKQEIANLLYGAQHEITMLRRENNRMAPQAEAYAVLRIALLGQPRELGMTQDIVPELQRMAELLMEKGTAEPPE